MSEGKRRKWPRRLAIGFGGFLLLLFLLWVFRFPLFGGLLKDTIGDALASEGIRLEVGGISGSLLTNVELTEVRVTDNTGAPFLKKAAVSRVRASYSLFGLIGGGDDWIEDVTVEGVTGVIDLDAPPAPPKEETPSGGGGTVPLPGHVRLADLDLTVTRGGDELVLRDAGVEATRTGAESFDGSFGAGLARAVVEGEEHRAEDVSGQFTWRDGKLVVDPLRVNGKTYEDVVSADLSAAGDQRIRVRTDLPIFGGKVKADVDLDLSGAHPKGTAKVDLDRMDPRPLLRFLPGVPVDVAGIRGTANVDLDGAAEPDLANLTGDFDLTLEEPSYEGRKAGSVSLRGTLSEGRIRATGRLSDPDADFTADVDVSKDAGPLDAKIDVGKLDLSRLELSPGGNAVTGTAKLSATVTGTTSVPEFDVDLAIDSPGFGPYGADRLELAAGGTPEDIRIGSLLLTRGDDRVTVSDAVLRPDAEPFAFSGRVVVDVTGVGAYREMIPAELPEDLAGALHVEVEADGTVEAPGATVRIEGTGLRGEGLAAKDLTIRARVPTMERIVVERLDVEGSNGLPTLALSDLEITTDESGTRARIGGLTATQDGKTVRSTGPALVDLEGKGAQVDLPLESSGARVGIQAGLGPDGDLRGGVTIHDADLAEIARVFDLPLGLSGRATGRIELGGTEEDPEVAIRLDVPDLAVAPPDRPRIETGGFSLRFRLAEGLARLEELRIEGPDSASNPWEIRAAGAVPFDAAAPEAVLDSEIRDGRFEIAGLPLDAAGPLPSVADAEGTLAADFRIEGTVGAPKATGRLELSAPRLVLDAGNVPEISGVSVVVRAEDLGPESGRIVLEKLAAQVPGASVAAHASADLADGGIRDPRAHLEVTQAELATVLGPILSDTTLAGRIGVALDLVEGPSLELSVTGEGLRYGSFDLGRLDLETAWNDGFFRIRKGLVDSPTGTVAIEGRIPLELNFSTLTAEIPSDGRPELTVRPDIDLGVIDLQEAGFRLSGRVSGELQVAGTVGRPVPTGALRFEHVYLRAAGAPSVDELTGTVRLDEDELVVDGLEAELGRGHIRIDGTVARGGSLGGSPGAVSLDIRGTDVQLVRDRSMLFRTDLDCELSGRWPDALALSGDVRVRTLRYTQDVSYLSSQPSLAPLPLTEDPVLSNLALDLVVELPPGSTVVRTNVLEGELDGRLEVGGTVAVPRPDGRVRIEKGGVAKLPTVSLDIEQGSIGFRRSEPLRPYLEAQLETTVSGTDIRVHVTGPASDIHVDLSSTPPLPEPDILSILLTGVPRSRIGTSTVGSVAATLLYRQLTEQLAGGTGSGEESTLSKLAKRVEVDVDTGASGQAPTWSATVKLVDDWLLLRGGQDDPLNYGVDLIFRLSFR